MTVHAAKLWPWTLTIPKVKHGGPDRIVHQGATARKDSEDREIAERGTFKESEEEGTQRMREVMEPEKEEQRERALKQGVESGSKEVIACSLGAYWCAKLTTEAGLSTSEAGMVGHSSNEWTYGGKPTGIGYGDGDTACKSDRHAAVQVCAGGETFGSGSVQIKAVIDHIRAKVANLAPVAKVAPLAKVVPVAKVAPALIPAAAAVPLRKHVVIATERPVASSTWTSVAPDTWSKPPSYAAPKGDHATVSPTVSPAKLAELLRPSAAELAKAQAVVAAQGASQVRHSSGAPDTWSKPHSYAAPKNGGDHATVSPTVSPAKIAVVAAQGASQVRHSWCRPPY